MARVTAQSSTEKELIAASSSPSSSSPAYLVKNKTKTASVYLATRLSASDSSTVAESANSFEWEATDGPLTLVLATGQSLRCLSAGADQVIHILPIGR